MTTFILEDEKQMIPNDVVHVVVKPTVQKIKARAFAGCSSLETIELPSNLVEIAKEAFKSCSSLKSITIPPSVTIIAKNTFLRCQSLTSVILPPLLKTIQDRAFCGCRSLSKLDIPSTVTRIEHCAFFGCSSLTSICLPPHIECIEYSTFHGCVSLTAVDLSQSSSVKYIKTEAFAGCHSLTSIDIPPSVVRIDHDAFGGCHLLISAHVPLSTSKGSENDQPFRNCYSLQQPTIVQELHPNDTLNNDLTEETDIFDQLKKRFHDKELHQLCHSSDVTAEKLRTCIHHNTNSAHQLDAWAMTPLHVLMCNSHCSSEMMNIVVDANPNALQAQNIIGMYPVQLACLNSNIATNGIFSALVDRIYEFGFRELLIDAIDMKDMLEKPPVWMTNIIFEMFRNKPDILTIMDVGALHNSSISSSANKAETNSVQAVHLSQNQVEQSQDGNVKSEPPYHRQPAESKATTTSTRISGFRKILNRFLGKEVEI